MGIQICRVLILVCLFSCALFAQVAPGGAVRQPATAASAASMDTELNGMLRQIEQSASNLNLELGKLRVEKWKTDSASKRQAESNIDSVQRNLTAALPGFVSAVRQAPRNIAPGFRLYRNLSALSEVLNSIAESAGAFGPRGEFERLADNINGLETARTALGKRVESLAEAQAVEIARLRSQVQAQAKAPGKVVVDDNAARKVKSTARKKPKPAPSQPATKPPSTQPATKPQ